MTAAPPAIKLSPAKSDMTFQPMENHVFQTAPAATPAPATQPTTRSLPNRTTLLPTTRFALTAPPLATKSLLANQTTPLLQTANPAPKAAAPEEKRLLPVTPQIFRLANVLTARIVFRV